MAIEIKNTGDGSASFRKVLLVADAGWGKTTQFRYYKEHYGPGFVISGEGGLSSIEHDEIDYAEFNSWEDFREIFLFCKSEEFKERGYKWIAVDSLTELSSVSMAASRAAAEAVSRKTGKDVNNFAVWGDHANQLIGACKAIRDMKMHVILTALAKSGEDENGNKDNWPMVDGRQCAQQLPGLFDLVLCGVRRTADSEDKAQPKVHRYIICDEVHGWRGKVRDPKRRIKAVEKTHSVIDIIKKLEMTDEEFERSNQS